MLRIMVEMYNADLETEKRQIGLDRDFGTVKYLIRRYELDAESPYHEISPNTKYVYDKYLKKLQTTIGDVRLDAITSKELVTWFNDWSSERKHLAAGRMMITILKTLCTYGIGCRVEGCIALQQVIKATTPRLPKPKKRSQFVGADGVEALRKSAHDIGRPSIALTVAFVFETLLRLYDVHQELDWSHIDDDLVLRYTPTKTGRTTGIAVTFDLKDAPMVMAELNPLLTSGKPKSGPIVVNEDTGQRYDEERFRILFRQVADGAGLPKDFWARDLRSSGITEARLYGADISDLAKMAGHNTSKTTSAVYDRAALASGKRVAALRAENRKTPA
jgi:integrase